MNYVEKKKEIVCSICILYSNQNIRMISEESCDIEDIGVMMLKIQPCHDRNTLHFIIHIVCFIDKRYRFWGRGWVTCS